jgi:hypothetical protein
MAWIGIMVTLPGLAVWSQGMFGIAVTQPGLGVWPQGMDWDYGHTDWFSSTASGHGFGLRSNSLV